MISDASRKGQRTQEFLYVSLRGLMLSFPTKEIKEKKNLINGKH